MKFAFSTVLSSGIINIRIEIIIRKPVVGIDEKVGIFVLNIKNENGFDLNNLTRNNAIKYNKGFQHRDIIIIKTKSTILVEVQHVVIIFNLDKAVCCHLHVTLCREH